MNDRAQGYGVFIDATGARYEGEWYEDKQHGQGVETWEGGKARYTGEFHMGRKNGRGKFEWDDGSYYEGEFIDGNFEGIGKL
jgi:hypothetical protein